MRGAFPKIRNHDQVTKYPHLPQPLNETRYTLKTVIHISVLAYTDEMKGVVVRVEFEFTSNIHMWVFNTLLRPKSRQCLVDILGFSVTFGATHAVGTDPAYTIR